MVKKSRFFLVQTGICLLLSIMYQFSNGNPQDGLDFFIGLYGNQSGYFDYLPSLMWATPLITTYVFCGMDLSEELKRRKYMTLPRFTYRRNFIRRRFQETFFNALLIGMGSVIAMVSCGLTAMEIWGRISEIQITVFFWAIVLYLGNLLFMTFFQTALFLYDWDSRMIMGLLVLFLVPAFCMEKVKPQITWFCPGIWNSVVFSSMVQQGGFDPGVIIGMELLFCVGMYCFMVKSAGNILEW